MRRIIGITTAIFILAIVGYFTVTYYATYSEGTRSGHLIKIRHKGMLFKTWEGEISQGLSGSQIFSFSILDKDKQVIADLQEMEGQYVKLSYIERYRTFPWWGDTKHYVTAVRKENSPLKFN